MKNYSAHILVVDDDEGIRDLVKQYLDQNNFLVSTANSAEDAFEKVKIIKFDLIVLDIMMPGKSGLEFTLENKKKIDTPIILLTAKGEASERVERGGHDFKKLYAAFKMAVETKGKPTVILAKTKKGYGMGQAGESKMTNHQQKTLNIEALKEFRDKFQLDISDNKLEKLEFYKPEENSEELKYLRKKRETLGGFIPQKNLIKK